MTAEDDLKKDIQNLADEFRKVAEDTRKRFHDVNNRLQAQSQQIFQLEESRQRMQGMLVDFHNALFGDPGDNSDSGIKGTVQELSKSVKKVSGEIEGNALLTRQYREEEREENRKIASEVAKQKIEKVTIKSLLQNLLLIVSILAGIVVIWNSFHPKETPPPPDTRHHSYQEEPDVRSNPPADAGLPPSVAEEHRR